MIHIRKTGKCALILALLLAVAGCGDTEAESVTGPAETEAPSVEKTVAAASAEKTEDTSAKAEEVTAEEEKPETGTADAGEKKGISLDVLETDCAPSGIYMSEEYGLLITDTYNKTVWQLTDEGTKEFVSGAETVPGLYGEPSGGYNDAENEKSLFCEPWAIAPFLDGFAVSDRANDAMRYIRPGQTTETMNGHSSVLKSGPMGVIYDQPTGLAADEDGNLFIADTGNGAIRMISEEGEVTTVKEGLESPMGLCYSGGVLYVAETGANRIISIKDGEVTVVAGSGEEGYEDGDAMSATFSSPQGVAAAEDGTLYIADTVNGAVRKISGGKVDTVIVADESEIDTWPVSPVGIMVTDDTLYVCDNFSHKVFVSEIR